MMNTVFGLAENALKLIEERTHILTNNITNSSTPNYQARDIDFHKILKNVEGTQIRLATSSDHHLASNSSVNASQLMYRIPMQKSLDGNTVDDNLERKNFLENSLRYQIALSFIQNKSDDLIKAIKGDRA